MRTNGNFILVPVKGVPKGHLTAFRWTHKDLWEEIQSMFMDAWYT